MNNKKKNFFLLLGAILILLLIFVFLFSKEKFFSSKKEESKPRISVSTDINRSFVFSAKDKAGEEEEISFVIILVKKANQIAVKGQSIEPQEGKAFLVLNLEMENKTNEPLFLYPSNFVRLVGAEGKKFAPDFHNDVAQIEPISVKRDQVAFIVPEEENNFAVLVGELDEEKETVEINF